MTKFLNISTDTTLGGNSPSDELAVSQKAIATALAGKQGTLTAGNGIDITSNTISANNIVWVTYNSTSFTDIKTLWDAGKVVMCKKDNQEFVCANYIPGATQYFYFTCVETYSTTRYLRVSSADAWITGSQTNQAYISDLATIRSGAEAGATAVQPGDLATVATSGDYDDLLDKPTIPTVNNATITVTQGGVNKGSFTLNQGTDATIALDAGGGGSSLPAGITAPYAGSTPPAGWLICDGSAINRTYYADLFAAIGTTYGVGDGSTTFNIPNYTGAKLLNSVTATVLSNNNQAYVAGYGLSGKQGYLYQGDAGGSYTQINCETGSHSGNWTSSSGGYATRNLHITLPNYFGVTMCIKY